MTTRRGFLASLLALPVVAKLLPKKPTFQVTFTVVGIQLPQAGRVYSGIEWVEIPGEGFDLTDPSWGRRRVVSLREGA